MATRLLLFSLAVLVTSCSAKFVYTYPEIARESVDRCVSATNFTLVTIGLRQNCRDAFDCVLEYMPNRSQLNLSSGTALLGFIPTVLLVLGNTNEDIIRINSRYPFLAFLFSITNVNKRHDSATEMIEKPSTVTLGLYGGVRRLTLRPFASVADGSGLVFVYALALTGTGVVVWQTIDLGRKSIVSWSCWVDYWLWAWLFFAIVHHWFAASSMRFSLQWQSGNAPIGKWRTQISDLTENKWVAIHPRFARWSKVVADLVIDVAYIYGTAIFSSLTLVPAGEALKILVIYGSIAVVTRIAAVWVLKEMDKHGASESTDSVGLQTFVDHAK